MTNETHPAFHRLSDATGETTVVISCRINPGGTKEVSTEAARSPDRGILHEWTSWTFLLWNRKVRGASLSRSVMHRPRIQLASPGGS